MNPPQIHILFYQSSDVHAGPDMVQKFCEPQYYRVIVRILVMKYFFSTHVLLRFDTLSWKLLLNGVGGHSYLKFGFFCNCLMQGQVGGIEGRDWSNGRALWGGPALLVLCGGKWSHCGSGLSALHRLWLRYVHLNHTSYLKRPISF